MVISYYNQIIWKNDLCMCCLNWRATAIRHNTLKSHKTVFIVWISWKKMAFESGDFHTKSNLLCLVCQLVVSFLFAPWCIFHCVRTWCVVWEWHGLSDIATVTKGDGSLIRVNCTMACWCSWGSSLIPPSVTPIISDLWSNYIFIKKRQRLFTLTLPTNMLLG